MAEAMHEIDLPVNDEEEGASLPHAKEGVSPLVEEEGASPQPANVEQCAPLPFADTGPFRMAVRNRRVMRPNDLTHFHHKTIIIGTTEELVALMHCAAVSWEDKAGSLLYHLFSYIHQEVEKVATFTTMADYRETIGLHFLPVFPTVQPIWNERLLITAALAGLFHSWNRKNKVRAQLFRRINAMAAGMGQASVNWETFQHVMGQSGSGFANFTGWLDDIAGMVIARNKNGLFDLNVTRADLIAVEDLAQTADLSAVAKALLTEMRYAFSRHHSRTALFAAIAHHVIQGSRVTVPANVSRDMEYFSGIQQTIIKSPYCSVASRPKEELQIRNYRYLAYIGLLYHGARVVDDTARREWLSYEQAVSKHVSSISDRQMCKIIQTMLPSLTISVENFLEKANNEEFWQTNENQIEEIFKLSVSQPNRELFSTEEEKLRKVDEYMESWKTGVDHLMKMRHRKAEAVRSRILRTDIPEEREALIRQLSIWCRKTEFEMVKQKEFLMLRSTMEGLD